MSTHHKLTAPEPNNKVLRTPIQLVILNVIKSIAITTMIFIISIASLYGIKNNVSLIDIVNTMKFVSLISLIIVSGEIAKEIDKNQRDIKSINHAFLLITIIIAIFQFIKILELSPNHENLSSFTSDLFSSLLYNTVWLSAIPILMYASLDIYIAYFRKSTEYERHIAIIYLIFVDITCIFPLILIFIMTYLHSITSVFGTNSELFLSGSMAMIIISSSIAAKAVDEFEEQSLLVRETDDGPKDVAA